MVVVPLVVLFAIVLVALLSAAMKLSGELRLRREPVTHWVQRSPVDRRQRQIWVPVERRKGPRRQAEIAAEFLAGLEARRHGPRTHAMPRLGGAAGRRPA